MGRVGDHLVIGRLVGLAGLETSARIRVLPVAGASTISMV
jgi:hypothetical protein